MWEEETVIPAIVQMFLWEKEGVFNLQWGERNIRGKQ